MIISKMFDSALPLMLLFTVFLAQSSLATTDEKANFLKDGNAAVNASTIVSDLKSGSRNIFAVGLVNSKLTLFVSDPSGGYQVDVSDGDHVDGIFKITTAPVPIPAGIPSEASVKFVCSDSTGTSLVAMSDKSVGALPLAPPGAYAKMNVDEDHVSDCYKVVYQYFSSSELLKYFTVGSKGKLTNYFFNGNTIMFSKLCNSGDSLGNLCISGDQISITSSCSSTIPTNFAAGFIGSSTAYLFDISNTVYVFDANAFVKDGPSVPLKKVTRENAWKTVEPSTPATPKTPSTTPNSTSTSSATTIIFIIFLLIFLISCGVSCYFDPFWVKCKAGNCCGNKGKKDDNEKKDKKNRKSKKGSSPSKHRKKSAPKSSVKSESKAVSSFKPKSLSQKSSPSLLRVEPTKTLVQDPDFFKKQAKEGQGKEKKARGVRVPSSYPIVVPDPGPSISTIVNEKEKTMMKDKKSNKKMKLKKGISSKKQSSSASKGKKK